MYNELLLAQLKMLAKAQGANTRNSIAHPNITEMKKQAEKMDQI